MKHRRRVRNRFLGVTRNTIPYLMELREIAGSVSATVLMQQLDYWFIRYPEGFYKFLEPRPKASFILPSLFPGDFFGVPERKRKDQVRVRPGAPVLQGTFVDHQHKLVNPPVGHHRDIGIGLQVTGLDEKMRASRDDRPCTVITYSNVADGFIRIKLDMGGNTVKSRYPDNVFRVVLDGPDTGIIPSLPRSNFTVRFSCLTGFSRLQ